MTEFDGRNPLEVLADDFTQRCRRGESPSISEYTEQHPELAEQINKLFPSIAMIEQLGVQEQSERRVAQRQAAIANHQIEQIGDYRILGETGRGGMGIVYEAVQESLGRRVAVKVLARQALLDEKHLKRFRREAKTAAGLHHTNIVPVFGVGEQDGYHYYVMQFIRGVGLDEVLAEFKQGAVSKASQKGRVRQVSSVVRALRDGAFRQPRKPGSSSDLSEWSSNVQRNANPSEATTPPDLDELPIRPTSIDEWLAPTQRGSSPTIATTQFDQGTGADVETPNELAGALVHTHPDCNALPLRAGYWHGVARIGIQVADALHYAHSQGILHRDIKPGNLLLDANGVVWVADFGLAKALEHDDVSQTGDVVGTLRYMAPEQFATNADQRSDIYSLGLTLYEALTLKPAYEDASRTHLLLGRGNGSDLVRPSKLNPEIPRDLETIVLKACARDPIERYQSADELAADLQNFLEDRPIRARRSTSLERLSRWCRRNPVVASLSGVAALLLILVAVSTSIGYVRTNAALSKAETTLGISLEALDKVYKRFAPDRLIEPSQLTVEGADGEQFEVPTQPVLSQGTAALLEDILAFYDRFAQQDSENIKLQAEAAKANRRVGDIQQRLGAHEQAERAYLQAIDKYEELATESGNSGSYVTELARVHNELGRVYRAWQRPDDAHASYLTALNMLQSEATAARSPSELRFELARTYFLLAKREPPAPGVGPPGPDRGPRRGRPPPRRAGPRHKGPRFGGQPPQRPDFERRPPGPPRGPGGDSSYFDQAITLLTNLDKNDSNQPEHRYLLALCYRERGRGLASDDSGTAIEILEELSRQYPAVADYRYELGETYSGMDVRRLGHDEWQVAEERLRKALAYADPIASEHPNVPEYAHSRAHANHKLATVLRRSTRDAEPAVRDARLREAEHHHREAVRIQSSLAEQFSEATAYRLWLAKMQESLARLLRDTGQFEEARLVIETSITNLHELLDGNPDLWFLNRSLAEHNWTLAEILDQLGEEEAASKARAQADQHLRQLPFRPPERVRARLGFDRGRRGN